MNIIDKVDNTVEFMILHIGDTFMYESELFMVVTPLQRETTSYNAVCFNDGLLYAFKDGAEVLPCDVTVEITRKGNSK
jgi:hypothetical protein